MPGWIPGMPKDGLYTRLLAPKSTTKRPPRPYGWSRPLRRKSTLTPPPITTKPIASSNETITELDKAIIDVLSWLYKI